MSERTRVLVVGARGAFGRACLAELREQRQFEVSAMVRTEHDFGADVSVVIGDATDLNDLRQACAGQDVIIYALNFPYGQWEKRLLPAVEVLAQVAEENEARVVLPGNVYGLDARSGERLAEGAPRRATERKGELRNLAEERLMQATARGARLLILRAGDFFGANAPNTWLSFMTQGAAEGKAMTNPQAAPLPHAWAYLPDLASTLALLLQRESELRDVEIFHFRGHEVSAIELLDECRKALGHPDQTIRKLPWWGLKLVGWFSADMREVSASRYLWEREMLLDQSRLERFLGDVPHTPLDQAVRRTMDERY